jgi:hypothetical protein
MAHPPEQVVEPMIAACIVFVAVQHIFWTKHAGDQSRRHDSKCNLQQTGDSYEPYQLLPSLS